jgi:prepilin-type processing-associated H-X9-DG protein
VSSAHAGGAQVAYADGYVQFLSDATPPEELRARLTINGGETVTFDQD